MRTLLFLLTFLFTIHTVTASDDYTVTEVMPGNFVHQGIHQDATSENFGAIANVGFIVGDTCIAVVDSGGSYLEGEKLLAAIREKSSLPICYVINTHVHPDHILGNAAFENENPNYVGHEKLPAALAARKSYFEEVFKEILGASYEGAKFISPTLTVSNSKPLTLDLGNRLITLTAYTTAHTDHDLTVLDHKTATLWAGDLLFVDRIPVMDGSINGWLNVMEDLQQQPFSAIIPGHGNPNCNDWKADIEKQKIYFVTIREQIRQILNDLGTIQDATETVGLDQAPNWELFEHYHRRNVTASFVELEWE